MDDVFALCAFQTPADGALDALRTILAAGMPVNIKVGELREESTFDLQASLGHLVCAYADKEHLDLAEQMIRLLLEFGFNWMLLDGQQQTPGDVAYSLNKKSLYNLFVDAGFRSEILLQKFLENSDSDNETSDGEVDVEAPVEGNNKNFLSNYLKYDENSLQTDENDGVMMDWETPIMKRSADLIAKSGSTVLNIGFGMGIIDTFIQEKQPSKHYIIEAHPKVLAKMKETGWYDKANVVVLEGTWKQHLPKLIEEGVQFDGIYYDTFSEHYKDMLVLFDLIVGILAFDGVFSYFNGLGADRQVCYDVYKKVALFNLKDYGLQLEFEDMDVTLKGNTWDNIKRKYFTLDTYSLPIVTFQGEFDEEEGDLVA